MFGTSGGLGQHPTGSIIRHWPNVIRLCLAVIGSTSQFLDFCYDSAEFFD